MFRPRLRFTHIIYLYAYLSSDRDKLVRFIPRYKNDNLYRTYLEKCIMYVVYCIGLEPKRKEPEPIFYYKLFKTGTF